MPRHKAITPNLESANEQRAKRYVKRNKKILYMVSWCFGILCLFGVILTELYFQKRPFYAIGYMTLGILCLLYLSFIIYTEIKGWHEKELYMEKRKFFDEFYMNTKRMREDLKNNLANHRVEMIICGLFLIGAAVYFFIHGIRAL